MKHAYFYGISTYIVKHRAYLSGYESVGHGVNSVDSLCVFVDNGNNGRGAIYTECRESLEVGLKACAARRVRTGNGEGASVLFHIGWMYQITAFGQDKFS